MKLNAKQALLAAAQVFEDYPERWTSNAYARDKNGRIVHKQSAAAFCFCGTGIIYRMEYALRPTHCKYTVAVGLGTYERLAQ